MNSVQVTAKLSMIAERICFSLILLAFTTFSVSASSFKTVFYGASVEFSCVSSFPPTWSWNGPKGGKLKTLAYAGTQPHPSLQDARFSFDKKDTKFIMKIDAVTAADAGTFNCQADSQQQIILNVLRYNE